jgi:hypothetical protein
MNYTELIEHLQKLKSQTTDKNFRKILKHLISLLTEIQNKKGPKEEDLILQSEIENQLGGIQTVQQAKQGFKKLRRILMKDFGFIPPNYYAELGMGIGVALGISLGTSFGIPFNKGIIYGPMIGSGIGVIAGLIVGRILDKKKEQEGMILKSL